MATDLSAQIDELDVFGVGLAELHVFDAEEILAGFAVYGIALVVESRQPLRKPLYRSVR